MQIVSGLALEKIAQILEDNGMVIEPHNNQNLRLVTVNGDAYELGDVFPNIDNGDYCKKIEQS